MDYEKILTLKGQQLIDFVLGIDPATLSDEFLEFVLQNKNEFNEEQLEIVCDLLGRSQISNKEVFLRLFIGHPNPSIKMASIWGLQKKAKLEHETLRKALLMLERLRIPRLGVREVLSLFNAENLDQLSQNEMDHLTSLQETFESEN